ncbi:hypothetical protein [Nakamurella multipartita]|uniref:Uncharacterized protein n=1 Tax=Nakamurella multipartita (strain ATCC 700099 / DSM 44233 / CIP 104796 / JCM 9543 / NBRC 105858 / Y-104) TaxID=479431 RepID=C8XEE1_NAKMY|nr:hypothetical protein [Nakamurella multipartita]ACV77799.1 hypothetical protein Namu_1398 [Nakamurella multipartita DSM 44233]HOZ58592.1 hypothetical protein [Nakamurella multipartita]
MVPTLYGRIQTRIVLTIVVGGLWTLIITPFLPTGEPLGPSYRMTFAILLTVLVLGIVWEFIYHGLQQFRWEKDWPTFFGFLTMINEGLLVWILLKAGVVPGVGDVPLSVFLIQFITTWLVIFLVVNGPVQIFFSRWRFRGGRFW